MQQHGAKLKPEKCELFHKEVCYLGQLVSEEGVKMDPKDLEAVRDVSWGHQAVAWVPEILWNFYAGLLLHSQGLVRLAPVKTEHP